MLDPSVFKAYDVRGVYPTELDEEGAYAIGRAYVEHFEQEPGTTYPRPNLVRSVQDFTVWIRHGGCLDRECALRGRGFRLAP